jgi:hypothetical protein
MTEIYNYPKTSVTITPPRSCISTCNPTYPFYVHRTDRQSNNTSTSYSGVRDTNNGFVMLNPTVFEHNKVDPNYREISGQCSGSSCGSTTYLNSDPRLCNAAGSTWLQLDRLPLSSTVKLDTLTKDRSLDRYGQHYNSYADINTGQIMYYLNRNSQSINFPTKIPTVCEPYTDPMGVGKPYLNAQYDQGINPITSQSCNQTDIPSSNYCLSWIRDSQYQRDDITALKMRGLDNNRRYS